MRVVLTGNLLSRGHDALEGTQVDANRAGVAVGLLDHASDDVTLDRREMAVLLLILGLAQTLEDHLASRRGSHAPEVIGGAVVPADDLPLLVLLRDHDGDIPGLAVELDLGPLHGSIRLVVGVEEGVLQGRQQVIERDVLVPLNHAQGRQVDVHLSSPPPTPVRRDD